MTPAELVPKIAPEFATVDLSGAILVAEMEIAANFGGDTRPLLVAYLAAHILTIGRRPGGSTGAISSISEGQASITFTQNKSSTTSSVGLCTTYGQEYDRLRRSLTLGAVSVGSNVSFN
jgi:hypothetical protein